MFTNVSHIHCYNNRIQINNKISLNIDTDAPSQLKIIFTIEFTYNIFIAVLPIMYIARKTLIHLYGRETFHVVTKINKKKKKHYDLE